MEGIDRLLPTKDQLQKRKADVNIMCPVCNVEQETLIHSLVFCPFASSCWNHLGFMDVVQGYTSFMHWLSIAMQKYTGEELKKIIMLLWSIWKNRNEIVLNQKGMESSDVVLSASLCFNQWKSAQDRSFDNYLGFITQADGKEHWERPNEGTVKINTDAALFEDSNCYVFSMISRNHSGELVEAVSTCRQANRNPELAEAIGIREALSCWVKGKEWPVVVMQTDCLSLVQAIRCSSVNLSYLDRVVDDCKCLLAQLKSVIYIT